MIEFCASLPGLDLDATTTGTYGSIRGTFDHLIRSDAGYQRSLTGSMPEWSTGGVPELEQMAGWAREAASRWEAFLAEPVDATRLLLLDQGTYEVNAGIVIAQVIHHGSLHREQICAVLTSLGIEPPDLQPWGFADSTGRSRWIRS